MGFLEKFFDKRAEEKHRINLGGLEETKGEKTKIAMNTDLPAEERRKAFQEAKEAKDQIGRVGTGSTEMLKQEALRQNEVLKAKLQARDEAKLEETRKVLEEGIDITDQVEDGSIDVDFEEDEQKAA